MTTFTFANNISTTLAGALSTSATSLTLSSAANLPSSIPAGNVLVVTLNDQATRQQFEVIYATAVSGATLSGLLRAQEGTAALAWSAGDFAYSAPTAGQMRNFPQLPQFPSSLGANGWKKYPDPNSPTGSFIEQWGIATTSSGTALVTYPIPFPNAVLGIQLSEYAANGWGVNPTVYGSGTPEGLTNFTAYSLVWNGSAWATSSTGHFYWQAKGY